MRASILLLTALLLASCGEPTDRPEDCDSNEYFDDARKLCYICPAPVQPTCDLGCGVQLTTDNRGCAAVECLVGDDCTTCGPTEYVDESLQCVPCSGSATCADGEPRKHVADGTCTLVCE